MKNILKCPSQKKTQTFIQNITDDSAQEFTSSSLLIASGQSLAPLSLDEHKKYLLSFIRQWCFDYKECFHLNELGVKEGSDFMFDFSNTNDNLQEAVHCKCGIRINLGKNGPKFQPSNFYKHLRDSKCLNIIELKKKNEDRSPLQQTTSLDSLTLSSKSSSVLVIIDISTTATATLSSNKLTNENMVLKTLKSQKEQKNKFHFYSLFFGV
ncbi:unnamed protein product [Rotaria sp. Silwood2]|nr:unnamed protein product [Rotaria sp. Silwood2]